MTRRLVSVVIWVLVFVVTAMIVGTILGFIPWGIRRYLGYVIVPVAVLCADSGDCGQRFRLNATMQSDRRRPPVPTKAAGVSLPA
jgi:hypothetical protein